MFVLFVQRVKYDRYSCAQFYIEDGQELQTIEKAKQWVLARADKYELVDAV